MPGEAAAFLVHVIKDTPRLIFRGLHAYDGHIHDAELAVRRERAEAAFAPVLAFRQRLEGEGAHVAELVAGGSPTFGYHAEHADRVCSPGTTVLWDFGYGEKHPDLAFLPPPCCSPASSASRAKTASPSTSATNPWRLRTPTPA